jgi:hypothetical protein
MKKYLILILFSMPLSSCKEFLDEKMVSTITQDYFESEKGVEDWWLHRTIPFAGNMALWKAPTCLKRERILSSLPTTTGRR